MKIFYSPTSPYSAKVRMAAIYLDFDVTAVEVATSPAPAELLAANPLGKIPTLLTDDGDAVFDSRAIMHYLHRLSGEKLYPSKDEKRTRAEVLEALCDGITDSLLSIVYERRMRPENMVHQPWIDRQWEKVSRGLDHLESHLPKTGKSLHGGHFALAALTGYLALRFGGQWEAEHPKLAAWPTEFAGQFKSYAKIKPQA